MPRKEANDTLIATACLEACLAVAAAAASIFLALLSSPGAAARLMQGALAGAAIAMLPVPVQAALSLTGRKQEPGSSRKGAGPPPAPPGS